MTIALDILTYALLLNAAWLTWKAAKRVVQFVNNRIGRWPENVCKQVKIG